jgi:hypothetical protein
VGFVNQSMGSIGLQQEKDIGYSINKESFELQEN